MVKQPAARRKVYEEIYKDFVEPGIKDEFKDETYRRFVELLSENPAYVKPTGRPQVSEVDTQLKPTGEISDMPKRPRYSDVRDAGYNRPFGRGGV